LFKVRKLLGTTNKNRALGELRQRLSSVGGGVCVCTPLLMSTCEGVDVLEVKLLSISQAG